MNAFPEGIGILDDDSSRDLNAAGKAFDDECFNEIRARFLRPGEILVQLEMGERLLTEEERSEIWNAIGRKRAPDDRDPEDVVEEDYKGDREHYLRVMAGWHNIPIGLERIFLRIKGMIGNTNIGKEKILEAIGEVSKGEIVSLVAKLNELKNAVGERLEQETTEIVETARSEAQLSSEGLPSHMADFYDNEVSATHIAASTKFSDIDQAIDILAELGKTVSS